MRLCLNDAGLGGPYKNITLQQLQKIYDIGFRVAGMHPDIDASDDDIKRIKEMFEQVGLSMGPLGVGLCPIRPDKAEEKEHKRQLAIYLKIGGKLGCTGLRYSIGSMDPDNIWITHPDNFTQKAMDLLVESVKELVPVAEDSRCMLCPETTQWSIVHDVATMKEYVDRTNSPYSKFSFDFVNHMTYDRVYESGKYAKCAVAILGDRIGEFHVKDVKVDPNKLLISHIDECDVGTGVLDHAAIMEASNDLEPWKTFSMEHFRNEDMWKPGFDHIKKVADSIGHTWTDPKCTREAWESGKFRK
jgi:sugar phosphate isomerase/epimerase